MALNLPIYIEKYNISLDTCCDLQRPYLPSDQRTIRALLSLIGSPLSSKISSPFSSFTVLQRIVFSTYHGKISTPLEKGSYDHRLHQQDG